MTAPLDDHRHEEFGPEFAQRLGRSAQRVGVVANLIGAVVVFALLAGTGPADDFPPGRRVELVILFGVSLLVIFPAVVLALRRRARPVLEAVARAEPLRGELREALLDAPRTNALAPLSGWAAAAVIFSTHSALRLENPAVNSAVLGFEILLGGLTTAAAVYLMIERVMRPVFARLFVEEPPEAVRGVAVGPRLVLSWALGAAIPLVAIAIQLLNPDASADELRRTGLAFVLAALVAGWLIIRAAARSVAEPIAGVRQAMARVREGDLGTSVAIDDATEVGLLQAGFNEMVAGLRERERLQDLFGRHVGEDVAREALEQGVSLGGEVREATALFVDLIGSTALASTRSPTEVVGLLNTFFECVIEVTAREGGWVNKFEGDAALCIFGAPVHDTDHAARALRTARGIAAALTDLRNHHPELDAAIGVSSGEVVAGNVGAEDRLEYTMIGTPVNEAARLTEAAKERPARVLAAAEVVRRAGEEACHWESRGTMAVRGRPEPLEVFELAGTTSDAASAASHDPVHEGAEDPADWGP